MPQMSPMLWDIFILWNILNLMVVLIYFSFSILNKNFTKKSLLAFSKSPLSTIYRW